MHAINEEYVEGVEALLEWEEKHHVAGEPYVRITSLLIIYLGLSVYREREEC